MIPWIRVREWFSFKYYLVRVIRLRLTLLMHHHHHFPRCARQVSLIIPDIIYAFCQITHQVHLEYTQYNVGCVDLWWGIS